MFANNTKRLIEEIEKRPAIWDVSTEEYSNRYIRKKNWKEVVDIFVQELTDQEEVDARTRRDLEDTLMKKWKCIRGCFTRELARQKAKDSGDKTTPRKSEYIYFKQLQFLKNSIRKKGRIPKERERSVSTNSTISQDIVEEIEPVTKRIKIEKTDSEYEEDPLTYIDKSIDINNHDPFEQDEDKMFLLSLLSTLKKVPENEKIATRIKIMTVLQEATQKTQDRFGNT